MALMAAIVLGLATLAGCAAQTGAVADTKAAAESAGAPAPEGAKTVVGKVKKVVKKSRTISVVNKDKKIVVVGVTKGETEYVNARRLNDIDPGEKVKIVYEETDAGNVAISVERVLAKLPEGVPALSTEELKALIDSGKEFTLVDARPKGKYDQGHIPGAISIPFPALQKAHEAGTVTSLLPKDKNAPLVFYCGGDT